MARVWDGCAGVANARDVWTSEAGDFTPWLAENLDVLADEFGMSLTPGHPHPGCWSDCGRPAPGSRAVVGRAWRYRWSRTAVWARQARTSWAVSYGAALQHSWTVTSSASSPAMVATDMRVPRTHGTRNDTGPLVTLRSPARDPSCWRIGPTPACERVGVSLPPGMHHGRRPVASKGLTHGRELRRFTTVSRANPPWRQSPSDNRGGSR